MVHIKHCRKNGARARKPRSAPFKVGAKTLAGVGIGMGAVILGSTAVSLVGGAALIHAVLLKLGAGAGLTGGGIGFYKGLAESRDNTESDSQTPDKQARTANNKEN
jgi:hypothetical protein